MYVYRVYVTPASGVGGEFPQPARITKTKRIAVAYASACEALGQKTRITRRKAKHGGSMVVILPAGFETKKKNLSVIERLRSNFEHAAFYPLPDGSFKESGTNVSTVCLHATFKE